MPLPTDGSGRLYRPDEQSHSASGRVPQWALDDRRGHVSEKARGGSGTPRWRPVRVTLPVALMVVLGVGAWGSMTGRPPASLGGPAAGERTARIPYARVRGRRPAHGASAMGRGEMTLTGS